MRTTRMLDLAAVALVVMPNGVFSLLPGCCGPRNLPDAPEEPHVRAWSPEDVEVDSPDLAGETGEVAETGGTGDTGAPSPPVVCDGEPALALYLHVAPEPLPDDLFLSYGGKSSGCGGIDDDAPLVLVAPTGLEPGAVDATWTVTVEGGQRTGHSTWDLECRPDGQLSAGGLDLDLPASADDTDVKLLVEVVDAAGTTVSAVHTFRAHMTQE